MPRLDTSANAPQRIVRIDALRGFIMSPAGLEQERHICP
jgi:hypothetical protein